MCSLSLLPPIFCYRVRKLGFFILWRVQEQIQFSLLIGSVPLHLSGHLQAFRTTSNRNNNTDSIILYRIITKIITQITMQPSPCLPLPLPLTLTLKLLQIKIDIKFTCTMSIELDGRTLAKSSRYQNGAFLFDS